MPKPTLRVVDRAVLSLCTPHLDPRPARNIVTRRGKSSRGYFPSLKASASLKYESQVELAAFRVLEIASVPLKLNAQPASLRLTCKGRAFRYTPDLCFTTPWKETIFAEVKPDRKFLEEETVNRLRAVTDGLMEVGAMFIVLLESDLKPDAQFQDVLERLLRRRPWRRPTPPGSEEAPPEELGGDFESGTEWQQARRACDELIERVMDRGFLQTIVAAQESLEV